MSSSAIYSTSPASILFTHSSDELYGSDVVLLELVRRLDATRFRPFVVTPTDIAYEGQLSQALAEAGIAHRAEDMPVLRRRYMSPQGLPAFVRRVRHNPIQLQTLAIEQDIALVHSNTSAVWGGALVARRCNLPHVWHVHELITRPSMVRKFVAHMIGRYSDRVVAISQAVADNLLADQPDLASSISVIYDAVDSERFHPQNDDGGFRQCWGIDSDDVLIGVVGRISAWKGQSYFLRSFALAAAENPKLKTVIVGDVVSGETRQKDELIALSHELGIDKQVIWAGYIDQAPQVMAALDILVLPSTQPEPFGMVVVEAMASERPVIATAHGGPLETVVDGETGYLVYPTDPQAMAAAMKQLATHPDMRHRFGKAARARVLERFSFENHVAAFEKIYAESLLSHS